MAVSTQRRLAFTMNKPTTQSGANWGWVRVSVKKYTSGTGPAFDAFKLSKDPVNNIIVRARCRSVMGATLDADQAGYPKDGWVLAYFDDDGNLVRNLSDGKTRQRGCYARGRVLPHILVNPGRACWQPHLEPVVSKQQRMPSHHTPTSWLTTNCLLI